MLPVAQETVERMQVQPVPRGGSGEWPWLPLEHLGRGGPGRSGSAMGVHSVPCPQGLHSLRFCLVTDPNKTRATLLILCFYSCHLLFLRIAHSQGNRTLGKGTRPQM